MNKTIDHPKFGKITENKTQFVALVDWMEIREGQIITLARVDEDNYLDFWDVEEEDTYFMEWEEVQLASDFYNQVNISENKSTVTFEIPEGFKAVVKFEPINN